jgi:hypothetical protein
VRHTGIFFYFFLLSRLQDHAYFTLLLSAQDISKDAAKFVSDALDIYLQVAFI